MKNASAKIKGIKYTPLFTSDEVELHNKEIYLIDAKHTKEDKLPSLLDIKDGLLKMILFTNLEERSTDK